MCIKVIFKVTQTKHHWWWKANQVFEVLDATKKFNGSIVFLEEDHLLAPDALHLLNLMEQQKKEIDEKVLLQISTNKQEICRLI